MKNKKLKAARAMADITQDKLAEAVGVSRQTIHSIETGKFVPSVKLALKIAQFLKKKVEYLFSNEEEE